MNDPTVEIKKCTTEHFLLDWPTDKDPLVEEACYQLANEKYNGNRKKAEGVYFPYVVHPLIAYNILKHFIKVDQPCTRAAVLLHDCLEDVEALDTPEKLRNAIIEKIKACHAARTAKYPELEKYPLPDAFSLADTITDIVETVTNPKGWEEGKRHEQIDKIIKLGYREKLVKLADAAASMVEDLIEPAAKNEEWKRKTYNRGRALAAACMDSSNLAVRELAHFVLVLGEEHLALLDPQKKRRVRTGLDFKFMPLITHARNLPLIPNPLFVEETMTDSGNLSASGIHQIYLSDYNGVCGCRVIVSKRGDSSEANKTAERLEDAVERMTPDTVRIGPVSNEEIPISTSQGVVTIPLVVRDMWWPNPIGLQRFFNAAREAGALSPELDTAIEKRLSPPSPSISAGDTAHQGNIEKNPLALS